MRSAQVFIVGLLFCVAPVFLLMSLAPPSKTGETGFASRYLALNNWDSFHYRQIATSGYVIPEGKATSDDIHGGRANVVFFPGYPMTARAFSRATGVPVPYALLLVAQAAAILFWSYLFLLLRSYRVSARDSIAYAAWILIHPAAFFLVTGYTESLFLAMTMGFLYWTDRFTQAPSRKSRSSAWILAAVHGFGASATRIVAFAASIYPTLRTWRPPFRIRKSALVLGPIAVSGALCFFAWCHFHFGRWNVYFELEETGWGNERMWFAILNPLSYLPRFFFEHTVDSLNRLAVLVTAIQFFFAYRREKSLGFRGAMESRLPLYVVAFFLFYIPLTGKAAANMDSMARYTLPVYILLILCHAQSGGSPTFSDSPRKRRLFSVIALLAFAVQIWFSYRFLRGHWVA